MEEESSRDREKIPRPRNAFILFRQHHHRLLIDELTAQGVEIPHNSKISKMLGVKWQELSGDEKAHWRRLAEKEKTDHERRYPDYRYKPVRKPRKKQIGLSFEQQPPGIQVVPSAMLPAGPPVQQQQADPASQAPYFLRQPAQPYYVHQAYPPGYYVPSTGPMVYQAPMPAPVPLQMQMRMRMYPHSQMQLEVNQQQPHHHQQAGPMYYYTHPPKLHPLILGDRPATRDKNDEEDERNPASGPQ